MKIFVQLCRDGPGARPANLAMAHFVEGYKLPVAGKTVNSQQSTVLKVANKFISAFRLI